LNTAENIHAQAATIQKNARYRVFAMGGATLAIAIFLIALTLIACILAAMTALKQHSLNALNKQGLPTICKVAILDSYPRVHTSES
jgi:hypothetical protein